MSVRSYEQAITADGCAVRMVDRQRVSAVSAAMPAAETVEELAQMVRAGSPIPGGCG